MKSMKTDISVDLNAHSYLTSIDLWILDSNIFTWLEKYAKGVSKEEWEEYYAVFNKASNNAPIYYDDGSLELIDEWMNKYGIRHRDIQDVLTNRNEIGSEMHIIYQNTYVEDTAIVAYWEDHYDEIMETEFHWE